MKELSLKVGQGYTKEQIEEVFDTNFGARIKGITPRRTANGDPFTIIFSRATGGPYTDRIEGNSFFYDGEGAGKDQTLTSSNKSLMEANNTGRLIYGFRQKENHGEWIYLGILKVFDYAYRLKNGYMTYEFHFLITPVDPAELSAALKDIESIAQVAPQLTSETRQIQVSVTARNAAFRNDIKKAYNNSCAICGKKRFSAAGYPEVEAAHIYPKEKNGSDDLRNGLALCKLHHWAFDAGLVAISDDLSIIVHPKISADDNYEDIYRYVSQPIDTPEDIALRPHPLFLAEHRRLHGYEK